MNKIKIQKFSKLIKHRLYDLFKNDLLCTTVILTITRVEISDSLSYAYIYILNNNADKKIIKYLNFKNKYFKYLLSQKIKFKRVPNLVFYYDEAFDSSFRLYDLLDKLADIK